MAIWQYTFELVPAVDSTERDDLSNSEHSDKLDAWKLTQIDLSTFLKLTSHLTIGNSWNENLTIFGSEDSTCLKLLTDRDRVVDAILRIDFREDFDSILDALIEFCCLKGFLLFAEDGTCIPLNQIKVRHIIESSSQYKKIIK